MSRRATRAARWWAAADELPDAVDDALHAPDPWGGHEVAAIRLSDDQRSFLAGDLDQPPPPRLRAESPGVAADPGATG